MGRDKKSMQPPPIMHHPHLGSGPCSHLWSRTRRPAIVAVCPRHQYCIQTQTRARASKNPFGSIFRIDGGGRQGGESGARWASDIVAPLVAVAEAISMDFARIFYPLQDMIYFSHGSMIAVPAQGGTLNVCVIGTRGGISRYRELLRWPTSLTSSLRRLGSAFRPPWRAGLDHAGDTHVYNSKKAHTHCYYLTDRISFGFVFGPPHPFPLTFSSPSLSPPPTSVAAVLPLPAS